MSCRFIFLMVTRGAGKEKNEAKPAILEAAPDERKSSSFRVVDLCPDQPMSVDG